MSRRHGGRRTKKHEDHANHEAWAIPYADLLTLLLAFFVVMYAISQVNEGKYRVLSDSIFAAFRGSPRTMDPIQVGEKQVGSGADIQTSIVQQQMLEGQPRSMLTPVPIDGMTRTSGPPESRAAHAAAAASSALQKVADDVERAMDSLIKQNLVFVHRSDFWIEVEIRTDLLFPSGTAQLQPSAVGVIEKLATSLAPFPNPIRVEGHTDNVPIKTVAFYSNWELSAARAGSVVRVLSGHGVNPNRLAVIGYGEQRPLKSNDTAEGRNANRRVVVVILSTQLNAGGTSPQATQAGPAQAGQAEQNTQQTNQDNALPSPAAAQGLATPGMPAAAPQASPVPATAPAPAAAPVQTRTLPNSPIPLAQAARPARSPGTEAAP